MDSAWPSWANAASCPPDLVNRLTVSLCPACHGARMRLESKGGWEGLPTFVSWRCQDCQQQVERMVEERDEALREIEIYERWGLATITERVTPPLPGVVERTVQAIRPLAFSAVDLP